MNNNLLTIILLFIFIFILYTTIQLSHFTIVDVHQMLYYDEENNKIDHITTEDNEQKLALKYIKPDDVVLELGARYGTVTCIISKLLNDSNNLVTVEPDSKIWASLEKNLKNNNCKANIHKGFISNKKLSLSSNGYSSTSEIDNNSTIPTLSLDEIKKKYNIKDFNTLIVDCEGCLEMFLDENPTILNNLNKIMYEKDYPNKCNYDKIESMLKNNNFKNIENIYNHQFVWIK